MFLIFCLPRVANALLQCGGDRFITALSYPLVRLCTSITGSLTVSTSFTSPNLHLPNLLEIKGDVLLASNGNLQSITMPSLRRIGKSFDLNNNQLLTNLELQALVEIGQSLYIYDNKKLNLLDFPFLAKVGGNVGILDNGAAPSLWFPSLAEVLNNFNVSATAYTCINFQVLTVGGLLGEVSVQGSNVLDFCAGVTAADLECGHHSCVSSIAPPLHPPTSPEHSPPSIPPTSPPWAPPNLPPPLSPPMQGSTPPSAPPMSPAPDIVFCDGDRHISSTASHLTVQLCTFINGSLSISSAFLGTIVHLPYLVQVEGDVLFHSSLLVQSIDLPELKNVGGNLDLHNNIALISLDLRSLAQTGSSLEIYGNPLLNIISCPLLAHVGSSLSIYNNGLSPTLWFPVLKKVLGDVTVAANTYTCINFKVLTATGLTGEVSIDGSNLSNFCLGISASDFECARHSCVDGAAPPTPLSPPALPQSMPPPSMSPPSPSVSPFSPSSPPRPPPSYSPTPPPLAPFLSPPAEPAPPFPPPRPVPTTPPHPQLPPPTPPYVPLQNHASPPPVPPGGKSFGDPHLTFAHGGQADFRGCDGCLFNFLSARDLSLNVKTDAATFILDGATVHGTFISEVHFVWYYRTVDKWLNLTYWANEVSEGNWGWRVINGTCMGRPFKLGPKASRQCDSATIRTDYASGTIETPEWVVTISARPVYNRVHGPKHRLDIGMKPRVAERDLSAWPHGVIGQSFDGDGMPIGGKKDNYTSGVVFTKAMAEGAIEGNASDYQVFDAYETRFKYSRFDATMANSRPRAIARVADYADMPPLESSYFATSTEHESSS